MLPEVGEALPLVVDDAEFFEIFHYLTMLAGLVATSALLVSVAVMYL